MAYMSQEHKGRIQQCRPKNKLAEYYATHGTNTCCQCGRKFTEANPCWNDYGHNEDGTHVDGVCKRCSLPRPRFRTRKQCEVIVGNIGTVYSGTNHSQAMRFYLQYKQLSQDGRVLAAKESVTLLVNGDIEAEYHSEQQEFDAGDTAYHALEHVIALRNKATDIDEYDALTEAARAIFRAGR